jgi:hypothetical protein
MAPRNDPGLDQLSFLRVGMSQLVSEPLQVQYITYCPIFKNLR